MVVALNLLERNVDELRNLTGRRCFLLPRSLVCPFYACMLAVIGMGHNHCACRAIPPSCGAS
eukprot:4070073-Pleurochrysis_carterae.AAC.2